MAEDCLLSGKTAFVAGVGFAALVLVLGCSGFRETPGEVARSFWDAIQAQDSAAARALCTTPDLRRLESFVRGRSVEDTALGQTLKNEESALVETSLVTSEGGAALAFNTHLSRIDRSWKIDLHSTMAEMRRAALETSLREIDLALQEGAQILGAALEQGAREASDALRHALEELEREFGGNP